MVQITDQDGQALDRVRPLCRVAKHDVRHEADRGGAALVGWFKMLLRK
jgi:hypothetical protein